jgi:hypothetical protein
VADHCSERIVEEMKKEILKHQNSDLCHSIEQVFLKVIIKIIIILLFID